MCAAYSPIPRPAPLSLRSRTSMSLWKVVPGWALNQVKNSDVFWSNVCCVMTGELWMVSCVELTSKLVSKLIVVVLQSRSVNPLLHVTQVDRSASPPRLCLCDSEEISKFQRVMPHTLLPTLPPPVLICRGVQRGGHGGWSSF